MKHKSVLAILFVAAATAVVLATVAVVAPNQRTPAPIVVTSTPPSQRPELSRRVHLIDFLPANHVRDGSVDYSAIVRQAFQDAAEGVLVLPPFPVRVSRAQGQNWCVRVDAATRVEGTPGSALIEVGGGVQLLRVQNVRGFTLTDVTLRGRAAHGQGLAHGLLQTFGGGDIHLERVRIDGCDADGIAVANAEGVVITACSVKHASKSAIYVNGSSRVRVIGNEVVASGGHRTNSGAVVGTGIQLSSNRDVICSQNVLQGGTGVGILVNALEGGAPPVGTLLTQNRVTDVSNPTNGNVSGGIRLANGSGDGRTQSLVTHNSLRGCGQHGIYVENHHGVLVTGNVVLESERAGLLVSSIVDAVVTANFVQNSGVSGLADVHQIQLLNQASGVLVRSNVLRDLAAYDPGAALDAVGDSSQGLRNELEQPMAMGEGPRMSGASTLGDVVLDRTPSAGDYIGWVCVRAGEPGVWKPFGRIEH
jgi:hypothetical protein